jgi:hypothetical protein
MLLCTAPVVGRRSSGSIETEAPRIVRPKQLCCCRVLSKAVCRNYDKNHTTPRTCVDAGRIRIDGEPRTPAWRFCAYFRARSNGAQHSLPAPAIRAKSRSRHRAIGQCHGLPRALGCAAFELAITHATSWSVRTSSKTRRKSALGARHMVL